MKITALAQSHGVQVNPHVWGSGVAQAASLQLIAALPVSHHAVFPTEPILEYDMSSHLFSPRYDFAGRRPAQWIRGHSTGIRARHRN